MDETGLFARGKGHAERKSDGGEEWSSGRGQSRRWSRGKKEVVQMSEDREVDGKRFLIKARKGQKRKVRSDNDEIEGRCGG